MLSMRQTELYGYCYDRRYTHIVSLNVEYRAVVLSLHPSSDLASAGTELRKVCSVIYYEIENFLGSCLTHPPHSSA